jgi:hypothetical protein
MKRRSFSRPSALALSLIGAGLLAAPPGVTQRGSYPPSTPRMTPMNSREVSKQSREQEVLVCAIEDWRHDGRKPILTLVCPPDEIFAPLRVLITLSWAEPRDIPRNLNDIEIRPRLPVKLTSTGRGLGVRLPIFPAGEKRPHEDWLWFTEIQHVRLLREH